MLKFITLLFITFYLIQTIEAKTCYMYISQPCGDYYKNILNEIGSNLISIKIIGINWFPKESCNFYVLYKC
jgi:hypothetical protein